MLPAFYQEPKELQILKMCGVVQDDGPRLTRIEAQGFESRDKEFLAQPHGRMRIWPVDLHVCNACIMGDTMFSAP